MTVTLFNNNLGMRVIADKIGLQVFNHTFVIEPAAPDCNCIFFLGTGQLYICYVISKKSADNIPVIFAVSNRQSTAVKCKFGPGLLSCIYFVFVFDRIGFVTAQIDTIKIFYRFSLTVQPITDKHLRIGFVIIGFRNLIDCKSAVVAQSRRIDLPYSRGSQKSGGQQQNRRR